MTTAPDDVAQMHVHFFLNQSGDSFTVRCDAQKRMLPSRNSIKTIRVADDIELVTCSACLRGEMEHYKKWWAQEGRFRELYREVIRCYEEKASAKELAQARKDAELP